MRLIKSLIIFLCLLLLWPQLSTAIEVTHLKRLELFEHLQWCRSTPGQTLEQVIAGGCDFKATRKKDLVPGFSTDVFWLRLTLHNTMADPVERWLSIGHPRLQYVTLYREMDDGIWQRTETGLSVPVEHRPLLEPLPMFSVNLAAGETRTYYIRVASETSIQLSAELWEPKAYDHAQQRKTLFQLLVLGGLIVAVGFSLMMFFNTREKTYGFFCACLSFEILQDAGYTGLLQLYLWPPSLIFPLQFQVLTTGLTLVFFVLFVRDFLGAKGCIGWVNRLLVVSTLGAVLATGWGCLVSYGTAVRVLPLFVIGIVLSSFGLFIKAWRQGSRPAGYLMLSYSILSLMLVYRVVVAFGVAPNPFLQSLGYAWCFLLITPLILSGALKRTEALREALLLSQAEVEARIKFMAQMSHEFRSPLNTILGYAELQERGIQPASLQANASHIKYSGRQLLSMIDEILEHARGEAGLLKLELAPVNWATFVSLLRRSAEMMTQARGNRFKWIEEGSEPEAVVIDERRLLQVLNNLLGNANRYTENGIITLVCAVSRVSRHRSRLTFTIQDSGAGIAQAELNSIFQPFVRGDAGQASGIDGIGMGLAIVLQQLGLMGGDIHVESTLGLGSEFSFSIECETCEPPSNNDTIKIGALPRNYRVLVVDDALDSSHVLSLLLADYGFEVSTAESGNAAARQYLGKAIDLVITDQFMAAGDGWSVLQDWSLRKVPVILLSAAPPERPTILSDTIQFRRLLMKPVEADVLLAAISEVLAIKWLPVAEVAETTMVKISMPPAEILAPLQAMIEAGAVSDILQWLETCNEQHPEYSDFWQEVSKATWALDFNRLSKLLSETTED